MAKKKFSIGVVGYSAQAFDTETARRMIAMGLSTLALRDGRSLDDVEVVSGYTALGVPLLAYEWAKQNGIRTVGVACAKAKNHECFPVAEVQIVGANWGDESAAFLARCDALLRVGGGPQSLAETAAFKATGKPVLEYNLEAEAR